MTTTLAPSGQPAQPSRCLLVILQHQLTSTIRQKEKREALHHHVRQGQKTAVGIPGNSRLFLPATSKLHNNVLTADLSRNQTWPSFHKSIQQTRQDRHRQTFGTGSALHTTSDVSTAMLHLTLSTRFCTLLAMGHGCGYHNQKHAEVGTEAWNVGGFTPFPGNWVFLTPPPPFLLHKVYVPPPLNVHLMLAHLSPAQSAHLRCNYRLTV